MAGQDQLSGEEDGGNISWSCSQPSSFGGSLGEEEQIGSKVSYENDLRFLGRTITGECRPESPNLLRHI